MLGVLTSGGPPSKLLGPTVSVGKLSIFGVYIICNNIVHPIFANFGSLGLRLQLQLLQVGHFGVYIPLLLLLLLLRFSATTTTTTTATTTTTTTTATTTCTTTTASATNAGEKLPTGKW